MSKITFEEVEKALRLDSYKQIAEEYPKLIKEAYEHRWAEISAPFEEAGEDPVDWLEEEKDLLALFKYRMSLMVICCFSEFFEQDLCNYFLDNGEHFDKGCIFKELVSALDRVYHINVSDFPKIGEMHELVNAIKHGDGRSLENIKRALGESVLADSCHGYCIDENKTKAGKQSDFDRQTLTTITLNVEGKLQEYCSEVLRLWGRIFEAQDARRSSAKQ